MSIGRLKARIDKLVEDRAREAALASASPGAVFWLPFNGRETPEGFQVGVRRLRFFDPEARRVATAAGANEAAALEAAEVRRGDW